MVSNHASTTRAVFMYIVNLKLNILGVFEMVEQSLVMLPCLEVANFCVFISVSDHLLAQYNAIKMLHSRVKIILDYIKAVQKGEDHKCLLKCKLCMVQSWLNA